MRPTRNTPNMTGNEKHHFSSSSQVHPTGRATVPAGLLVSGREGGNSRPTGKAIFCSLIVSAVIGQACRAPFPNPNYARKLLNIHSLAYYTLGLGWPDGPSRENCVSFCERPAPAHFPGGCPISER